MTFQDPETSSAKAVGGLVLTHVEQELTVDVRQVVAGSDTSKQAMHDEQVTNHWSDRCFML